MPFFKSLGIKAKEPDETETVRRLIRRMEGLDPKVAKFHALFACILCRVARTDLVISPEEIKKMEDVLTGIGHLSPDLAALVVEIAKVQNQLLGGVENYLFTREFCSLSTLEERLHLLDCLFAVAASENLVDTREEAEIRKIADELMISRQDLKAARSRFHDHLAVLQRK